MEISQERLKQIIKKVLQEQSLKSLKPKEEKKSIPVSAYVLCEAGHEAVFLSFLRENKSSVNGFSVTAVLEKLDEELLRTLLAERLCERIARPYAVSVNDEDAVTIYPSFSRSSMCEVALGMDTQFSSAFMRKDFEAGRKSVVLLSGLEAFSGKEPIAYREKIVSYIREMLKMGVRFVKDIGGSSFLSQKTPAGSTASDSAGKTAANKAISGNPGGVYRLKTQGNLITASDIRKIPAGSTVYFAEQKILTPLAKDAVQDLNLKLLRG